MAVLVLNAGSSSLKFALVEPESGKRALEGESERIGTENDQAKAVGAVLDRLTQAGLHGDVEAVGHRVVHGGEAFADAVVITEKVEATIVEACRLAPLHNPANLAGIRAARAAFPGVPQVAVFDTAFHQTLEPRAFRYAVPDGWYREHGVRKYGFHGTSHRYVAEEAARRARRPLAELQILTAHLGNGCSACAVKNGKSVDTTMGLTPLAGLVMGSRSGDIDPSIIAYIGSALHQDAAAITRELNEHAGLLGLSGLSNDMRALLEARAKDHAGARLAIDVFCHRLASSLFGLAASLDRVDGIVFTAGIGEHSAPIRAEVGARLGLLGARVDPDANARHGGGTGLISVPGSVPIWVIATNEEWMIARDTRRLTRASA